MTVAIITAGLLQGSIYALISIGLTLMFGVLRIINFAHGDFMMVAMYATFILFSGLGVDPLLSLVVTVPGFVLAGAIIYSGLIRRTFAAPEPLLAQVFVTVGLSIFLQNLALLVMGADYFSVRPAWSSQVVILGTIRMEWSKLMMSLLMLLMGGGLSWFLFNTSAGRRMRAVAENPTAATLMGINVQRVYTWTFAAACGIVAVAGAMMSTVYLVYPTVGLHFALLAFMTIIIGGLGSIRGAIAGGLSIGLVEAATGFFFGPIFSQVFIYILFIAVLILRPAGLFGREGYLEARAE
jgi:branched-chain amino acid transport system permease protein